MYEFKDPAVRLVEEADIPALINLFKLNYGDDYSSPEFFDERWVKRAIYNDNLMMLVIEEDGEVVASGTIILDYGDHNDQMGMLGRLVVHPRRKGRNLGKRLVSALLDAAADTVEFAFGDARTVHPLSQKLLDKTSFSAVGFLPQYSSYGQSRESLMFYSNLYGDGRLLRREDPPQVIPEVAPLARHALAAMKLSTLLIVDDKAAAYPQESSSTIQMLERCSLAQLRLIERIKFDDPLLYGSVSLEHGMLTMKRRGANYLMATDENQRPVGAIGYRINWPSRRVEGIELVAESENVLGHLCRSLVDKSEELRAEVIEVNVSAYDARIQRTFSEHGFRAVAYAPAMVFHGTHRLDVVKMLKLNVPYDPGKMELTEPARTVFEIVEKGFK